MRRLSASRSPRSRKRYCSGGVSSPLMAERVLLLTGRLARPRLEKVLSELDPAPFRWSIVEMGVKVAALMTETIIRRRLDRKLTESASRVVLPGRCRADLTRLT